MENYDFFQKEDLPIFCSSWFFTLGAIHIEESQSKNIATFDLFIRELPKNRNYLVAAGLQSIINFLLDFKFTKKHIKYFEKTIGFSKKVIDYYKKMRFTGDLWAIPEGCLVFPNEPIIRITAPIVEAEVIERFLINTLMVNTMFASKISRYVNACKKICPDISTGLNYTRSHGIQASNLAIRNAKIVGVDLVTSPFFAINNKHKSGSISTTHAFISSFDNEEEALLTFSKHLKDNESFWLVDTFNSIKGIDIFIRIVLNLKNQKKSYPTYLHLDSGDLSKLTKIARKKLDKAGLKEIKICIATNLDEYKITRLAKRGVIADMLVAGTELTSVTDSPKLEAVYKLSQIEKNGKIYPKMKLSSKKISLPGKKQVYRVIRNGEYISDIIGLENEKITSSEKLLKHVVKDGRLINKLPTLEEINKYYENDKNKFNDSLFYINRKIDYSVKISKNLSNLIKETKEKIKR